MGVGAGKDGERYLGRATCNTSYTRQVSNKIRTKMSSAKGKINASGSNFGLVSGLLLWIPGFGNGKANRRSTSTELINNQNGDHLNQLPPSTNQGN